jgi:predicted unusual protein kinase regulating ubiquinone biosynthesis (AarF/ABC1/UbiB family)
VFVKFGQECALLQGMVPQVYCTTLKKLQDEVPSVSFDVVKQVIYEDFGKSVDELFTYFEEKPFAAASLAQVHKAKLGDTEVAVKIQYPMVRHFYRADLYSRSVLIRVLSKFYPELKTENMEEQIKATENLLQEELDFINEAQNAKTAAKNFSHRKDVYVPYVYDKYLSKRVLIMEYIHGVKVTDVEKIKKMGFSNRDVAVILFEAMAEQIFSHGFLHGDPHGKKNN